MDETIKDMIGNLKDLHLKVNGPSPDREIDPLVFHAMQSIVLALHDRGLDLPKGADVLNVRLLGNGMLVQYLIYIEESSRNPSLHAMAQEWAVWLTELVRAEINRRISEDCGRKLLAAAMEDQKENGNVYATSVIRYMAAERAMGWTSDLRLRGKTD